MIEEKKVVIDQIIRICKQYPEDIIQKIAATFLQVDERDFNFDSLQAHLLTSIPKADLRGALVDLFESWKKSKVEIGPSTIGYALLTALYSNEYFYETSKTELVWTGPNTQIIPLRRTDQALLQVINSANKDLLIVSFAVYKIDFIVEALQEFAVTWCNHINYPRI